MEVWILISSLSDYNTHIKQSWVTVIIHNGSEAILNWSDFTLAERDNIWHVNIVLRWTCKDQHLAFKTYKSF